MEFVGPIDILVFLGFIAAVLFIGLWMSKGEEPDSAHGAQDYFLAGRGLTWWLVGFSLIAANISTEQFVGMSGQAADWLGMAIASYEWMAAVTLVVVAFVFLPTFLRSGIYTIPEFLEYRYNAFARLMMAVITLIILVGVPTASVIFSGAKVITGNFQGLTLLGLDFGNITVGCYIIGILGAVYVFVGGLKACAWADLLQGSALIIGGIVIAFFAMKTLADADPNELIKTARNDEVTVESLADAGAVQRFWDLNEGELPRGKTHMVRPWDDSKIPWTALVVGLWIPNFFYWGLNQYITQRTLGSKSLAEGQKGVVFAAFLKLIIPFIVVIPGILAFNLFNGELKDDATNRNALILAEKTPELYTGLSDSMKPDRNDKWNKAKVDKIDELLKKGAVASEKTPLYKFNDAFAEVHTKADLLAIVNYNQKQVGSKLSLDKTLAENPIEADLAAFSLSFTEAAEKQLGKKVSVDELVAHDYDNAFPTLIRRLLPVGVGIKGFVLAAIFGAVISSLASMLNSASTIATMDIYRAIHPKAQQYTLVSVGRVFVVVFVLIAMGIAPFLGHPGFGGIFNFIQEFQGFMSPGVLAIFLFGLLVHRAPRIIGTVGLLLNPILYGILFIWAPEIAFLNRMAYCFFAVIAVLTVITIVKPLDRPVDLPVNKDMDLKTSRGAFAAGIVVVCLTVVLYIVFW